VFPLVAISLNYWSYCSNWHDAEDYRAGNHHPQPQPQRYCLMMKNCYSATDHHCSAVEVEADYCCVFAVEWRDYLKQTLGSPTIAVVVALTPAWEAAAPLNPTGSGN
jgi:hypothetical protein